jgi:hypothetical protein
LLPQLNRKRLHLDRRCTQINKSNFPSQHLLTPLHDLHITLI